MKHIAIMKKPLLAKILSGEKTIESRWYYTRRAPWDKVKKGDIIYFKNVGEPVTAQATVKKVLQFELDNPKIKELLTMYGSELGVTDHYPIVKNRSYCILMFLEKVKKIKPFEVDKKGHGMMSAWLSL